MVLVGDGILLAIHRMARLTRDVDVAGERGDGGRIDRLGRQQRVEIVHLPDRIPEEGDRVVPLRSRFSLVSLARYTSPMPPEPRLRQLKRGEHGRITTVPSVATVREGTGLSQPRFAELLGVSVRTLQEWEQGRRAPSGAARTLLLIAAKSPRALIEVA